MARFIKTRYLNDSAESDAAGESRVKVKVTLQEVGTITN